MKTKNEIKLPTTTDLVLAQAAYNALRTERDALQVERDILAAQFTPEIAKAILKRGKRILLKTKRA